MHDQSDKPDDLENDPQQCILTRSGIRITLSRVDGQETMVVSTPGGLSLTLQDNSGALELSAPDGNRITLDAGGITVGASGKLTLAASVVEIDAGELVVNAAASSFSGVVKADTVIANAVAASSYTPGAGNLF
jgi:hypothetical protein